MKKKIILSLLLIVSVFGITLMPIKADSGWDSSYDSGGWDSDWGGGSDWGSSWDSDYGSSSGGYYGDFDGEGSIGLFIGVTLFVLILIISLSSKPKGPKAGGSSNISKNNNFHDIDIEKINSIDPDMNIDNFKMKAFYIYKDIQTAWMNFDTDTIRNLTTDEIYNMYSSQLETLKLKNQKNIMKNIEYVDAKIIDIKVESGVITTSVYLRVKCLDYVINEKTNKTVRGRDDRRLDIEYILTFVKSEDNSKEIETCPNCGAPVEIVSSSTCPYCDSVLVKNASKYVMSKKTCINQRLG